MRDAAARRGPGAPRGAVAAGDAREERAPARTGALPIWKYNCIASNLILIYTFELGSSALIYLSDQLVSFISRLMMLPLTGSRGRREGRPSGSIGRPGVPLHAAHNADALERDAASHGEREGGRGFNSSWQVPQKRPACFSGCARFGCASATG